MDARTSTPFYTNGSGNGNDHGTRNGYPLLIHGRAIAALTNGDAAQRDAISGMLVAGEALLISWMIPQAAVVTLSTPHKTREALGLTPKERLAAAMGSNILFAANSGMSPIELDEFVRANLRAVVGSIERVAGIAA
jgi:hypothetical protein